MSRRVGVFEVVPQLFDVALESYEALRNHEPPERPALVPGLTVIVFAAASLEALVSEIAEHVLQLLEEMPDLPHAELTAFVDAVRQIERSRRSTRQKFLQAGEIFGRPYDRRAQPYSDYSLLTSVRDSILHLTPTTLLVDERGRSRISDQGVLRELQSRGLIALIPYGVATTLLIEVSRPKVGRWAINTAAVMAQSFLALFPDEVQANIFSYHDAFRTVE